MLGAGIEPAWDLIPRDFKSLASTGFATRAEKDEPARMGGTDPEEKNEAGNGTRTRDPNLGKVVLYQLSYSRKLRQSYRRKTTPTSGGASRGHQQFQVGKASRGKVNSPAACVSCLDELPLCPFTRLENRCGVFWSMFPL